MGITEDDWAHTLTILNRAERKSEIAMFTVALLWTTLIATLSLVFMLHGLWALLSLIGLAPVCRAFFYPKAIEELNEIYTKRHVEVAWVQSMCSTGFAFAKKKGSFCAEKTDEKP